MILSANRFVRNVGRIEQGSELRVQPAIIPFPERAKRVFVGIAGFSGGRRWFQRHTSFVLRYQRNLAIGAHREALSIFGMALRTDHRVISVAFHSQRYCVPASEAQSGY